MDQAVLTAVVQGPGERIEKTQARKKPEIAKKWDRKAKKPRDDQEVPAIRHAIALDLSASQEHKRAPELQAQSLD